MLAQGHHKQEGVQQVKKGIASAVAATILVLLSLLLVGISGVWAATALPETWYFAEGTTREGFYEYISLQNPSTETAHVVITYMTNEGPLGPFVYDINPVSRFTVNVNGYLDAGLDVSAKVESDQGLVAERPMYFTYKGIWEGGHVVEGVTAPNTNWYFAEGTTRPGFEEWLCIQNPQDAALDVSVAYITPDEVHEKNYTIAGNYRFTVDVNREVALLWPQEPYKDVSITVEAGQGIIAERPIYFKYMDDWEGGSAVVGETEPGTEWYLAEGYCQWNFDTWLCFLNPGLPTAHVTINYRRGDGATLTPQVIDVPGLSRQTVFVNSVVGQGEFSFHITSDQAIVVERPMYFTYNYTWDGGHDNMAIDRTSGEWYLAEGATWKGFETYLTILNPLEVDQTVIVEYLMEKGGHAEVEFMVPAHSRYTRNVNADVGPGHDVSFRVIAFKGESLSEKGEIVVERPMYFLYGGTLPGGHVASGYPAD